MSNLDPRTVSGFGDEWASFDQSSLDVAELEAIFESYFRIFPWTSLPEGAVGFDLGCGSGRWAAFVAARVHELHCVDASSRALDVARRNLQRFDNCRFHEASVDDLPLENDSMDFGYSLGVLHHVPETAAGIRSCVAKLKPGAPFLLYLYYAFDNRPRWFRALWRVTDVVRRGISRLPSFLKVPLTTAIAGLVYWPLARLARALEKRGREVGRVPLSLYRDKSFYTMRTDALDRFGTALEKRFTAAEIEQMMARAGLGEIRFSEEPPYWCAIGLKTG